MTYNTGFDSRKLDLFREDFEQAVKQLAEKYNVNITLGNIRYTEDSFTSRIIVTHQVLSTQRYRDDFLKYGQMNRLKTEWLDQEFRAQGKVLKLVGLDMTKRKKKVVVADASGEIFWTNPDTIAYYLR